MNSTKSRAPFGLDSDISYEDLELYLDRYGIYIRRLEELREVGCIRASELEFIEKQLVPAKNDWSRGVKEKNLPSLKAAKKKLGCALGRYHSKIDTALHTLAADMLPVILGVLQEISRALGETPVSSNFVVEIERLSTLNRSLSELVDHHHRWQEFDDEMRRIYGFVPDICDEISESEFFWDLASSLLIEPETERWFAKLRESVKQRNQEAATRYFNHVRKLAGDVFYDVDKRLKAQCDELPVIATDLKSLIERASL